MSHFDPAPYVARLIASRDFCLECIGSCGDEILDAIEDGADVTKVIKEFAHRQAVLTIGECIDERVAQTICAAHEEFDGPSAETAAHFNALIRNAA